jgi:uncharacterized protein YbbC (DUF1343 family)
MTDNAAIASELNALPLPGVRFDTATRTIETGYKFGVTIPMIQVRVTDRNAVQPGVGVWMLRAIYAHIRKTSKWRTADRSARGNRQAAGAVEQKRRVDALLRHWDADAAL